MDRLWRRETRQERSGKRYEAGRLPSSVLVKDWPGLSGIEHVLFTDFQDAGKISIPDPTSLAHSAIESVRKAKPGKDGISYLIQLGESGVQTVLDAAYRKEILRLTATGDLQQALELLRRDGV